MSRVVAGLSASGAGLAVGCASGADRLALSAALALPVVPLLAVFAVASGPASAPALASLPPGVVRWSAGGPSESGGFASSVPFRARLACRSRALVAALPAGSPLVVFFASAASVGSALAARAAAARGLPVFAFACGFPASSLPALGAGSWAPEASGVLSGSWRWCPAQSSLWPGIEAQR